MRPLRLRVVTTCIPTVCVPFFRVVIALVLLMGAATLLPAPAIAQNPDPKATEKADGKEPPKKPDEYAEAERLLGGPAAHPECLWLGRRVVRLLSRDDLDTAFRHLELYDRFGCPAGHVQAAFRCVIKQGEIDPKATEKLDTRVLACWVNPNGEAVGTAAAPSASSSR